MRKGIGLIVGNIWTILIELAFLGLLAFLYYLFQKSRILKRDRINIFETLEEMTADITKYIESLSDGLKKSEILKYNQDITLYNNENNYPVLADLMLNPPSTLPNEFSDALPSLHDQIIFHVKQK